MNIPMPSLLTRFVAASCLLAVLFSPAATLHAANAKEEAWDMLNAAIGGDTGDRVTAVAVLALITKDAKAFSLATEALDDPKPEVRIAACNSLAALNNKAAIPNLQKTLADTEISVVIAAAHALNALKDESAYDVYYAILTGAVKDNKGMIAKQLDTLKDPKELAKMGFNEGIGFVPFAGAGWDAFRMLHKTDPSPVRAAAASVLAVDPDPKTAEALISATRDKNWIVRVAALEALNRRGDPTLVPKIRPAMNDTKKKVRLTAAAVVIHLSAMKRAHPRHPKKQPAPTNPAW
jgi:HEAT repeat protein